LVRPAEEDIDAAKPDLMVINEPEQESTHDWMSPIKTFLDKQPPLDDNTKVERITRKSKMYHLIYGVLYRLRCQRHDNEVYPQRRRHLIASGNSQRCIWITLIMALYHWQGF
jgi:hypothetical protein